jgi:hypothetical protein
MRRLIQRDARGLRALHFVYSATCGFSRLACTGLRPSRWQR